MEEGFRQALESSGYFFNMASASMIASGQMSSTDELISYALSRIPTPNL